MEKRELGSKTLRKNTIEVLNVLLYSTVFIGVGLIIADLTTRQHYVLTALIVLGVGWLLVSIVNSKAKPQGSKTITIFCFKCQKIHEDNSVCSLRPFDCEGNKVIIDTQTGEPFCTQCGEDHG